jgi:hypothetical protein
MKRDLTQSDIHRKNILNNKYAIEEIEKEIRFPGILFENKLRYTKKQIATYYNVDERTINRYLETHEKEFLENGYEVLSGNRLKDFKEAFETYLDNLSDVKDINVPNIHINVDDIDAANMAKVPKLGVFTFRAFLNIGMLLTESDRAKQLRSLILDIVIDALNKKVGGATKYINQREEEFLPSAIREFNYRQEFTNALDLYIVDSKWKYAQFTDAVYKNIFHENAKEYKQILKLKAKENVRNTMYSEVLDLVAAYENGFADCLKKKFEFYGRKLSMPEANACFKDFTASNQAVLKPLLEKARTLMASRDMAFRDALHEKLKNYITHLNAEEFEKFLGERSKALEERLKDNIDVFKRLKDR